jgi:hypothetical protein
VGGQLRSGKAYYEGWEKLSKALDAELQMEGSQLEGHVPDRHAGSAAAAAEEGAAAAGGAARTQRLIEANSDLPAADRIRAAEDAKARGNDLFRCVRVTTVMARAVGGCSRARSG